MSRILNFTAAVGAIANLGRSDPVILGTISLTGMEVPDLMRVGGQQRLAIHNLPGGEKLIDVAGNDEARLELTGRFIGPAALERAQAVEAARIRVARLFSRLRACPGPSSCSNTATTTRPRAR